MITDGAARVAARYSDKAKDYLRLSQSLISGIWGDFSMPKLIGRDENGIRKYQYSFYPFPNQRKWITIKAPSRREADRLFRDWQNSYQQTTSPNSGELSFKGILEQFEIKCRADNDCDKTIKNYRSVYRNFFERFLPVVYPDVTNMQGIKLKGKLIFERYKSWVVVDCKREHGWREELTKIKVIFCKLNAIGLCDDALLKTIKEFKKPKRRGRIYKEVSREQLATLLKFIDSDRSEYYGASYLVFRYGWRRGQALTLKAKNIKWQGLRPTSLICEPQDTKTKEPFILSDIDPELANILKGYHMEAKKRNTAWLFPNRSGDKLHAGHYTEYIKEVSKKVLGVELKPHDFRHSLITWLKSRNYSDRDIMAITGHRDIGSLNIYSHATSASVKQIIDDTRLFDK